MARSCPSYFKCSVFTFFFWGISATPLQSGFLFHPSSLFFLIRLLICMLECSATITTHVSPFQTPNRSPAIQSFARLQTHPITYFSYNQMKCGICGSCPDFPCEAFFCRRKTYSVGTERFYFLRNREISRSLANADKIVPVFFWEKNVAKTETRYVLWSLGKNQGIPRNLECCSLESVELPKRSMVLYTSWRNSCAKSRFLITPPLPLCYTSCDGIRRRLRVRSQEGVLSGKSKIHLQKTYVLCIQGSLDVQRGPL